MADRWPETLGPVICVVGARPNFMKMAPILRAFASFRPVIPTMLLHTGQHYDPEMNDTFFADLHLPSPDINLDVGSATHAMQTAEIMRRFEPVLDEVKPSCVLVVGDVNSTLACTLVAVKKGIPVAHVEAGLRSHDRSMPEEINRLLTDQVADRLYTTEGSARDNLMREGIALERICFVGNVMIDSLLATRANSSNPEDTIRAAKGDPNLIRGPAGYGLLTLHRPDNVDHPKPLAELLGALQQISLRIPLVFPLHPRTRNNIERFGLAHLIDSPQMIKLPPQGYREIIGLLADARIVLTDSGGLQEESTALGVPCLTLRNNTERPITVEQGTNTLVGNDPIAISRHTAAILAGNSKRGQIPELWDGHAAERIVADLANWLLSRDKPPRH